MVLHLVVGSERYAELARQRNWAAQTDTKLASFQDQLLVTGDKAARTAGALNKCPAGFHSSSLT